MTVRGDEITSGFPEAGPPRFDSIAAVRQGLADVQYLADDGIAGVVFLADRLAQPVLVEGPAGTGKTELAKSVARLTGSRLIRRSATRASTSPRPSTSGTTRSSCSASRPTPVRPGRSWKRTSSPRSSS